MQLKGERQLRVQLKGIERVGTELKLAEFQIKKL
jgi:hypothetical protein